MSACIYCGDAPCTCDLAYWRDLESRLVANRAAPHSEGRRPRLLDLFCGAGGAAEAIPPAFTEFIGEQLLRHLSADERLAPNGSWTSPATPVTPAALEPGASLS